MIVSMTEETCCVALEKCEYHAGRRVELFGHAQRSVCALVSHVNYIVHRNKVLVAVHLIAALSLLLEPDDFAG